MTSGKDEFREIMGNPGRFFHPAREKVCRDRERMRPGGALRGPVGTGMVISWDEYDL